MIKEFSTWLTTRVAGLTIGGNLQVGFRAQDAPVRCHTILEGASRGDFYLPDRVDYLLQIATRANNYQDARADAWKVFDALQGAVGWNIPALVSGGQAYTALTIEAVNAPQYIGQDEKFNHEFSTNYLCRMKKAET